MAAPLTIRPLVTALRRDLAGCRRVLEVGCGAGSPLHYLAGELELAGLDIFEPWLAEARRRGILREYHLGNALELDRHFAPGAFDAAVALDLIEHLPKEQGDELLRQLERVARRRVILFTPNGFLPQEDAENPYNRHLCGWTTDELVARGYRVEGMSGWKPLRGDRARLRWRPRWLWALISALTQRVWCRRHPASAFALYGVKEVTEP